MIKSIKKSHLKRLITSAHVCENRWLRVPRMKIICHLTFKNNTDSMQIASLLASNIMK